LDRAIELVKAAHAAGAWGVKLQTFDPEVLAVDNRLITRGPWTGVGLRDLYRSCMTPREWHAELFDLARSLGLVPFSSAFSRDDVDFLETLGCPMYKIASFECVDLDLVRHAGSTGKRVVISTGMASNAETAAALVAAKCALPDMSTPVTLLKCTSAYPAALDEANVAGIRALQDLAYLHGPADVGLSDHTLGFEAACAATALGATMIEKHLTLARSDGGPDAAFSSEPDELAELVRAVAGVARSLGSPELATSPPELDQAELRRSLWIVADVRRGDALTRDNLRSCRPSSGIPAGDIARWLGKRAAREMKSGTPFAGAPDVMAS
jgi:N-acetylneuraminate synthase